MLKHNKIKGRGGEDKMKKLILISSIIAVMGLVFCVGSANAAFRVDNTGQIVYYSNIYAAYSYTFTDTARIVVLFGPEMYLQKNVRNEVTGESSANQVPAGRGDTITFYLYAANDQPNADTAAWYVIIYDTFPILAGVGGGATASVGQNDFTTNGGDSFTYVPGSETVAYSPGGETVMVTPNFITYYIEGTGWLGDFNPATQARTGTWYAYDDARESLITPKQVQGIKWFWTYVPSAFTVDTEGNNISSGNPYVTKVKYSIRKNNN